MKANGTIIPISSDKLLNTHSFVGHKHIDILKIDVEGWEFDILTSIIRPFLASGDPLPFGQLLMEIHIWNKNFAELLSWWEMLESVGLRPFMTEVRYASRFTEIVDA